MTRLPLLLMIALIAYDIALAVADGSYWKEETGASAWDDAASTDNPSFWE